MSKMYCGARSKWEISLRWHRSEARCNAHARDSSSVSILHRRSNVSLKSGSASSGRQVTALRLCCIRTLSAGILGKNDKDCQAQLCLQYPRHRLSQKWVLDGRNAQVALFLVTSLMEVNGCFADSKMVNLLLAHLKRYAKRVIISAQLETKS